MNYYERHIGDYLKDTAHLSLLEHGVYTRLLDVYYTREGSLPAAEVARLVGARSRDERKALESVLAEFFVLDDGMYRQDRCDREIARFQDKQRKAKASANARWSHTERNANASPNAMRTHSEGNAPSNQTPDTRHQKDLNPAVLRTVSTPPKTGGADPPPETEPEPPGEPVRLANGSIPPCPIAAVIDAYHAELPEAPRIAVRNSTRDRLISARWRQAFADGKAHTRRDGVELFREFFAYCRESKFLTGKASSRDRDKPPFIADLQWLMSPTNFAKTVEGRYHR